MTDQQQPAALDDSSGGAALPPTDRLDSPVEPVARRPRRWLRALWRWGSAVLVLGLSGTGVAIAVAAPDRTDIPGLRTAADGRYTFPELSLPALPSGKPAPLGVHDLPHFAALQDLMLPAPREAATPGSSAPASASAKSCDGAESLFEDPAPVKLSLFENACRVGAVRTWAAADGTRTEIWLLGFGASREADDFHTKVAVGNFPLKALPIADQRVGDPSVVTLPVGVTASIKYGGDQPDGAARRNVDIGQLWAGDIAAIIVMTNPHGVPDAAFRQVMTLQADLLG